MEESRFCLQMVSCDGKKNAPSIGENGNWYIGETDTGVKARGENGITPNIGENGHWFMGDTDTGVKAQGDDGVQGPAGPQGVQGVPGVQGPAGGLTNFDLIFDGRADTVDISFTLLKPITNYEIIAVEAGLINSDNIQYTSDYEWIINPVPTENASQHRLIRGINKDMGANLIQWSFPTSNTLKLSTKSLMTAANIAITKIYGVK